MSAHTNTISSDVLDGVMSPVNTAKGLPNHFYIDQQTFDEEKKRIFFDQWAAIGFAKDVPLASDAKSIDFLGVPLFMLRDKQDQLKVFQNTCRHRGMRLIEGETKISGAIRCPYHSWCYDLTGKLCATPHVGGPGHNTHEDIKRDELGLIEIRSHVWLGVVFVNISGNAKPFEERAGDLLERWGEFEQPIYHSGDDSSFKLEVKTNWKLAVENYCESYHLPWVHPGLNSYSKLEDHYNIIAKNQYSGQGTTVYNPSLDETGKKFKSFKQLSDKWDSSAEYVAFYPNVLLGVHHDHTFAIILEPKECGSTIEHIEIFYADEDSVQDDHKDMREKNTRLWKEVFKEDIFVVEGMQRGRHGPYFDGGKFSPVMDEATHCFHHWVASHWKQANESLA